MIVRMLAGLPDVELAGILVGVERPSVKERFGNLRRHVLREGPSYLWHRLGECTEELLRGLEQRMLPSKEVDALLHTAFPDRLFCLSDLGIPIYRVNDLNSAKAIEVLQTLNVDLGVVYGADILKRPVFSLPRLGCINLHKGKLPEYRGHTPGFWEIYDGQTSASVTVHFIDDGWDTGDVLNTDSIPISPGDTPDTLNRKLEDLGARVLRQSVGEIGQGRVKRTKQPPHRFESRTPPTRTQRQRVDQQLGRTREGPWRFALKSLYALVVFCSGLFYLIHLVRRKGTVILYHRVSDQVEDALTISVRKFAEHMLLLKKFYCVVPTSELVERIRSGQSPRRHAIVVDPKIWTEKRLFLDGGRH